MLRNMGLQRRNSRSHFSPSVEYDRLTDSNDDSISLFVQGGRSRAVQALGSIGSNLSTGSLSRPGSLLLNDDDGFEMRNLEYNGNDDEEMFLDKGRKKTRGWMARCYYGGWNLVCALRRKASKLIFRTIDPEARVLTLGDPHAGDGYCGNAVCNQKYSLVSFIPLVLFEQFSFFFNFYFLVVALSQFFTPLKIGYLYTYWGPLLFVLAVTMLKEASDDFQRYRRDIEVNGSKYIRLTPDGEVTVTSADIRVGDIIKVHTNERVPADMVFLRTTEKSGACFIRTDQLDGETDWKLRLAVPSCQKMGHDGDLFGISAAVYADKPIKDIHTFVGTFTTYPSDSHSQPMVEPLSVDHVLWTNTVVASGTAMGLVVYAGRETRSVMNTSQPRTKIGLLDHEINVYAKVLFVLTLALALVLVAMKGTGGAWYIYVFRFVLLFSYIIPISLRVNLDMAKTFYTHCIHSDPTIPSTVVRTSTIPEELGRVQYLLTDKTGTLTQNEMVFRKLHLGTVSYSPETLDDLRDQLREALYPTTHLTPSSPNLLSSPVPSSFSGRGGDFFLAGVGSSSSGSARVANLVIAVGLCHNVTPVIMEDGGVDYQAASPDEVALVRWTKSVGLALLFRDLTSIALEGPSGQQLWYDVLQVFPFTSETKRMGIVVRERASGEITFYCKGADAVMGKIVMYNDWLEEECGNMAREGLRTLVIARKQLSSEEYGVFAQNLADARCVLTDRDRAIMQVRMTVERDMELLGLTGVEDKLQEDIKPSLETLRNAGIRIWMLTGDKMETATNIAVSSRLVSRTQTIHQFSPVTTRADLQLELTAFRKKTDCCLVIDGTSLRLCLELCETEFMALACGAPAVVCCRCSPTQKADIVRKIQVYTGMRTLAIGDGGNDVSMIQAADVGVGLEGKEGRQASLAADFSLSKFKHVVPLLMYHGRNSYKRSAALAQFVIHRGLIISVMQAVFSAIFYFSAVALYQGVLMVGYTTVYTMCPVFSLVLDEDVPEHLVLLYPELYKDLTKGRALTLKTFFGWLLISTYQGAAIILGALLAFDVGEFVNIVAISFTALIFTELLMVALNIHRWHWAMVASQIFSVGVYFGSMLFLPEYFNLGFVKHWGFMWRVAVITIVSCLPLYVIKYVKYKFSPPSYAKLADH